MNVTHSFPEDQNRLWPRIAAGLMVCAWLAALQVLWRCYQLGGQKWLQGDWLINLAAGPIRRGPFGQVMIGVADLVGLAPVTVVLLVQATLVTLLLFGTALLVLWQSQPAMVLAVFSAGFFAVLWTADPLAGFRKEMLPLAALILIALPGGRTARLVTSAALLVAGAWGHELGVLAFPAWLVFLYLLPPAAPRHLILSVQGAVVVLSGAAAIYALRHNDLTTTWPLCEALLARQTLNPDFCLGAIGWLENRENAWQSVLHVLSVSNNLWMLPVAVMASVAPLVHLWRLGQFPRRLLLAVLVAIAPFCLLYPIAFDWGRWVSVQITITSFLLLGLGAVEKLPGIVKPKTAVFLVWLCLALITGLRTMTEVVPNALPRRVIAGFEI